MSFPNLLHRRKAFRGSSTFLPTDIADCVLWLPADSITGLNDGDAVALWEDLSSAGNDAAQSTGGARPTYQTGEKNGLPIVRFDGADDFLEVAGLRTNNTIIIATSIGAIDSNVHALFMTYGTDDFDSSRILASDGTGKWGTYLQGSSNTDVRGTGWHILTRTTSDGGGFYYTDGVADGTSSGYNDTKASSWIGCNTGVVHFTLCDIAEIIVFSRAITSDERIEIENYLSTKYGITVTH